MEQGYVFFGREDILMSPSMHSDGVFITFPKREQKEKRSPRRFDWLMALTSLEKILERQSLRSSRIHMRVVCDV